MNIPDFITTLVERGIPVLLIREGFEIDGFYKSGTIRVSKTPDGWRAYARYEQVTDIEDVEDLVALNYNWWQGYKLAYEGWSQPDSRWVGLLEEYGFITAEIVPERKVYK